MAVKNDQKLFKDEFFELIKIVSDPKCEETAIKMARILKISAITSWAKKIED